jgi:hypothetical protein
VDVEDAAGRLYRLHVDLHEAIIEDPTPEVQGWAIAQLRDVLEAIVGEFPPDEPAVAQLRDLMSPAAVTSGTVRATDLYLVVGQLLAALPSPRGGVDLLG